MSTNIEDQYLTYLETLAENWSSERGANMLTTDLVRYIKPRFHRCSSNLKLKIMLSFLYLSAPSRLAAKESLLEVLAEAELDFDDWVRKLSRLISSFVLTGALDYREADTETCFAILKHVGSQSEHLDLYKPCLDSCNLSNVLTEPILNATTPGEMLGIPDNQIFTSRFTLGVDGRGYTSLLVSQGLSNMQDALRNAEDVDSVYSNL